MQNTPKEIEDLVKEFGNKLAFKLNPSNDTMEAIRLLRKELPELLAEQDRISRESIARKEIEYWKDIFDNKPKDRDLESDNIAQNFARIEIEKWEKYLQTNKE